MWLAWRLANLGQAAKQPVGQQQLHVDSAWEAAARPSSSRLLGLLCATNKRPSSSFTVHTKQTAPWYSEASDDCNILGDSWLLWQGQGRQALGVTWALHTMKPD
jgi:hypothetical protein